MCWTSSSSWYKSLHQQSVTCTAAHSTQPLGDDVQFLWAFHLFLILCWVLGLCTEIKKPVYIFSYSLGMSSYSSAEPDKCPLISLRLQKAGVSVRVCNTKPVTVPVWLLDNKDWNRERWRSRKWRSLFPAVPSCPSLFDLFSLHSSAAWDGVFQFIGCEANYGQRVCCWVIPKQWNLHPRVILFICPTELQKVWNWT